MRGGFCFLVSLLVCACQAGPKPKGDPAQSQTLAWIRLPSADLRQEQDAVWLGNQRLTGILFQLDPSGDTVSTETYRNGRLDGLSRKWFANGQLMEAREYAAGRKQGRQIAYWPNGNQRFAFTAKEDAYEGELREWTESGQLFHLAHFRNGQEEGVQKLWYDNGKIRANYVIRDGRRYGLLGTKNCMNVSDRILPPR